MTRKYFLPLITALLAACAGGDDRDGVPETPAGAASDSIPGSAATPDGAAPPDSPAPVALPETVGDPPMVIEPVPPTPGQWRHADVEVRRSAGVSVLRDLRAARQDGFDRVVFDFGTDPVPGYHISYIDRPVRSCGSGEVVPLPGDGWLEIRMQPAAAHTEAGAPTIGRRVQPLTLPNLKQLSLTCDFEADVTWVAGVLSPNDFRVSELREPSRLVVDIRHR